MPNLVEQQPFTQDGNLRENDAATSRLLNKITSKGNLAVRIRAYTTSSTLDKDCSIATFSGASIVFTLAPANSWGNDQVTDRRSPLLILVNQDSNNSVTVNTTSGDTFNANNNSTTLLLGPLDTVQLITLGATWYIVGVNTKASAHKNLIINGNFQINQRSYVSAAVLAAGAYGHDRWKAGAGGGDYTFGQRADGATCALVTNKTLIQVIEDKNVVGGTYCLSWTGAAQARIGINTATPAGSYATSPIIFTGQTAGTTMSVEFNGNSGTFTNVQLESGGVQTPFEWRQAAEELVLAKRYYFRVNSNAGNTAYFCSMVAISATAAFGPMPTIAGMRTTPTVGFSALADITTYNGTFRAATSVAASFPPEAPIITANVAAGLTAGGAVLCAVVAGTGKWVDFSAEL